jgi:glycosyltransferase involved in cell wall biosynthesis
MPYRSCRDVWPTRAVMHLVDTLQFGGAERMAVDYVNHLPRDQYRPFLCVTRQSGPLANLLRPDVTVLQLDRRRTLDPTALLRLRRFVHEQHIELLHAHGSALFVARLAQLLRPKPALIWHLHYGRWAMEDRRDWRYVLGSLGLDAIVTSSDQLAAWVRTRFFVRQGRVAHVPNMVSCQLSNAAAPELPGRRGGRIVCVANLRPEKDHVTLLRAFGIVVSRVPWAHLLLIGGMPNAGVALRVEKEIARLGLGRSVSLLGQRTDVAAVLPQCDVAVLSSVSEGLPVSLLEYGLAGLPTVSTTVGQCPSALDHGAAGILVPPQCPDQLAEALESFLSSADLRRRFGEAFRKRVAQQYSSLAVIQKLCDLYERVLATSTARV